MIRVGQVGLGLIGRQRLAALEALAQESALGVTVVGAHDPVAGGDAASVGELIAHGLDWAFVATPHDVAASVCAELLAAGVNVFVEKPLGRSEAEARELAELATARGVSLRVGLDYRFFPGVRAALRDAREGRFGRLISVELLLGHGGSPGDEATWKLDPSKAGGGCLIDPGVHLLDLALLLDPAIDVVGGASWRGFWPTGIEEEAHVVLSGPAVPIANLAVSVVRWRSTFVLRINGEDGYGVVEGRGRSYGPQRYRRGKRWGWQDGAPQADTEEAVVETTCEDVFERETRAVFAGSDWPPVAGADDALAGMALLDRIRERLAVPIPGHNSSD